jgi:hypothetical protein
MLPFVFDPLHELLEALFAAEVLEEGVILIEKWVIDKPKADRVIQPIQGFFLFIEQCEGSSPWSCTFIIEPSVTINKGPVKGAEAGIIRRRRPNGGREEQEFIMSRKMEDSIFFLDATAFTDVCIM